MIWSCSSIDEEDQTKQLMSCPRGIYQVCQILARISGNNYTGREQCPWFTMWINSKGDCWPRTIGWHMAMQGYLSEHWRLAISANRHLEENNDKGKDWVCKTVMLLWDFAHGMWEHRNSVLHDTKLKASCAMHEAKINDAITKLYKKVDTYSTEDWWYFDVLLAIQLCKPL